MDVQWTFNIFIDMHNIISQMVGENRVMTFIPNLH